MNQRYYFLFSLMLLLAGCHEKASQPVTDVDVAAKFINDIFKNDFKEARTYLLEDSSNVQIFDRFKDSYQSKSPEQLEEYRNAYPVINEISPVNDSVTIINYSNSFNKQEKNKVKVVRLNGRWLVDLKYTFSGNL